jgi:hypothetical protein
MSVPDPLPPRKPRRLGLYLPFLALLIAVVVWSGFWFWLRIQTNTQIEATAESLRKAGYEMSWSRKVVGGYPFRLNVLLTDARIREPSGWTIAAPKLEAESFVHGLGHWIVAAPDGLTLVRPRGGPVDVKGAIVRASLSETDKTPPRLSFEGTRLTFAPGPGAEPFPLSAAERVELHLRPGPDDQAAVFFKVDQGKARLSGLFARIAGDRPISIVWDALLSRTSAFRGDDWPSAVRAWTAAGGEMKVREAGITAGDALIGARSGALTVGSDGRLRGALDVSLRQAPKALTAMGAAGVIPQDQAATAAAVAAARQGDGDVARATLTFQAGQTTLGPAAIGPAPRVY